MALREYFKVDLTTGKPIDNYAIEDEDIVAEDMKLSWGGERGFHKPVYDFELGDWIEGKPQIEIDTEFIKRTELDEINELETYLRTTDWYLIRSFENGKSTPSTVLSKRSTARDVISNIKTKYNLGGNQNVN